MLLDAAPTILSSFPQSLQRRAARDLERLGVELHLGARVTGVDARGIDTTPSSQAAPDRGGDQDLGGGGRSLAAGTHGRRGVGRADGSRGRVEVLPDCTLPGHPEVFVIGDLMSLDGLPGVAQVAIQSGRHAAATIARRLRGDAAERPFRYRDRGTMATISRFRAVAASGGCACRASPPGCSGGPCTCLR